MNSQASEQMNSTSSPISSGLPKRPGRDRQRANALYCEFARHAKRHRHDRAFRRRVVDGRPGAAAAVRHARHVDNDAMPVGKHVRQQSLHAVERAIDVEREGFLHQGIVDFEKFGAAADGGAGGVEQELDLAESCNCAFRHFIHFDPFGDVDLDG